MDLLHRSSGAVQWNGLVRSRVLSSSYSAAVSRHLRASLGRPRVDGVGRGEAGDQRPSCDRLFEWPAGWQWYVFAVGYIAAIKLTAAIAHRLISGAWPPFGNESWYVIAAAIVISTPIQAGEEMGWRGYALPRLATRFGFASASLMLGLVWGVWHLPLFFVAGLGNYGQSFPVFVLGSTMLSVAIAWLYAHTNGSLLLAMLMHSAANQTTGIVPTRMANPGNPFALDTSLVTLLSAAIGLMTVGYFLARMPKVEAPGRVDRAVALVRGVRL